MTLNHMIFTISIPYGINSNSHTTINPNYYIIVDS